MDLDSFVSGNLVANTGLLLNLLGVIRQQMRRQQPHGKFDRLLCGIVDGRTGYLVWAQWTAAG